jgi:hypothetical protein
MHFLGLGLPYDVNDLTKELAKDRNEIIKAELEVAKVPTELVKLPEAFKKDIKWRPWKESVVINLHSKKGNASLPLAYIIRDYDMLLPNMQYVTTHDQLVACAILQGPKYANNGIVFDLRQRIKDKVQIN